MIMIPFPKTVILTLLLAALASAGAGAQVSVSPASLEWAASSTGEEAVYVSVSSPWTAEIYPDTGHFTLDSAEGEDSDFIHIAPSSANALTTAVTCASSSSAESPACSERGITYDRNGSLLTLFRYGKSALSPETVLSCSYSGVRRTGWSYDADGNVTSGPYGGRSVSYNLLDLPSGISGGGVSDTAGYGWLADGTKYSAAGAQSGSGRDYRGTFVYGAGGTLESVAFSGGRIHRGQAGLMDDVRYHVCDHLGSVRAVVSSAGEVLERSDYYPYGGRIGVGADGEGNRWRYGGKEEQAEVTGLGLLDFGARLYGPAAVSWTAQDPLSEKYPALTPYLFCAADPVNLADPDGRKVLVTANGNGTYTVQGGELDEDLGIYLSRPDGAGGWTSTGVAIGKSLFSTSFYNTDTESWCVGAIINPNDMSGIDFMNNTIKPIAHRLGHYMHNATGGKIYDFKLTNGVAPEIDENGKTITIVRDPRRGMPYGGDGIYASARDIGNIAAGYVAGVMEYLGYWQGLHLMVCRPVKMENLCLDHGPKKVKHHKMRKNMVGGTAILKVLPFIL